MDETNPAYENFRNKMEAFGKPFRETTRKVSASKFLGRDDIENKVEINARKITILKNIIQAQQVEVGKMISSLTETSPVTTIEKEISDVKELVISIKETLIEQDKSELEQFYETQRQLENEKRRKKETALEKVGSRTKSFINSTVERIVSPVKNIFVGIIQFFTTLFFGKFLMKFLNFLSNPKNLQIVLGIADFIQNNFELIIGVIGAAVIGLGVFAAKLIGIRGILSFLTFGNLFGGSAARVYGSGFGASAMTSGAARSGAVPITMSGGQVIARNKNIFRFFMNDGGIVPGMGNQDTVPAMLTPGEVVISKPAVERIGAQNLLKLNYDAGKTNKPMVRNNIFYANEGMITPLPKLPGLGGGGGGTDAITMKSTSKSFGKKLRDVGKISTIPFRALLGIKSSEDPTEKFASAEDSMSLDEKITFRVDEAVKKYNIRPVNSPIIPSPPIEEEEDGGVDLSKVGDQLNLSQSDTGPLRNEAPEGDLAQADPKVLAVLGIGVG